MLYSLFNNEVRNLVLGFKNWQFFAILLIKKRINGKRHNCFLKNVYNKIIIVLNNSLTEIFDKLPSF